MLTSLKQKHLVCLVLTNHRYIHLYIMLNFFFLSVTTKLVAPFHSTKCKMSYKIAFKIAYLAVNTFLKY